MKMNPTIKQLWCEHLRSDWYDQNFQRDSGGYIPLRTEDNKWNAFGVLCNIHAQTFPDVAVDETRIDEYLEYEYIIPNDVAAWAGLKSHGVDAKYKSVLPIKETEIFGFFYNSIESLFLNGIPFFMIADIIDINF
jgi:hypothetical protein